MKKALYGTYYKPEGPESQTENGNIPQIFRNRRQKTACGRCLAQGSSRSKLKASVSFGFQLAMVRSKKSWNPGSRGMEWIFRG